MIPQPNRRGIVHARVVLMRAALGRSGAVGRIRRRTRIDHAQEQDGAPIGAPQRVAGSRRDVGDTLRFTSGRQVQQVDLRDVVTFALRAERDAAAVGAPGYAAFPAFGIREPPRLAVAVSRDDPEIADLVGFGVGRLGHTEYDRPAVGTDHGGGHTLHEEDVLVCDRVALLRRERRTQQHGASDGIYGAGAHRTLTITSH